MLISFCRHTESTSGKPWTISPIFSRKNMEYNAGCKLSKLIWDRFFDQNIITSLSQTTEAWPTAFQNLDDVIAPHHFEANACKLAGCVPWLKTQPKTWECQRKREINFAVWKLSIMPLRQLTTELLTIYARWDRNRHTSTCKNEPIFPWERFEDFRQSKSSVNKFFQKEN